MKWVIAVEHSLYAMYSQCFQCSLHQYLYTEAADGIKYEATVGKGTLSLRIS